MRRGNTMPYIKQEKRKDFDKAINLLIQELEKDKDNVEGNLNYIFTKLILGTKPSNYKQFNRVIGALECCKLEMYRKKIGPYEDVKIKENGDVE